MHHMLWKLNKNQCYLHWCVQGKKWAWPKMGGEIEIKIVAIANMI